MAAFMEFMQGADSAYLNLLIAIMRYLAPALALLLLLRCFGPLYTFRREPEIWGWLCMSDGTKLPITHWENVIGRHKRSDIVIDFPTVSRTHGVLTRYDDGSWTITDTDSSGGILVNGKRIQIRALLPEDVISIGGIEMTLQPISRRQELRLAQLRTPAASAITSVCNVLLLSLFQLLTCIVFLLDSGTGNGESILIGFGGILISQWLLLLFYICIRRASFEVETIAFFMCTLGMAVIATIAPDETVKQLIAMLIGLFLFLLIGWSMRDLERAKVLRYLAGIAGVGFLLITLVFGQEMYGAKNWLTIGGFSFQPSEFVKICFIFAGAASLDRMFAKRNLIMFIGFAGCCVLALVLMSDLGSAVIFFVTYLIIAFMRSGSVGTVFLSVGGAGLAAVLAVSVKPYIASRFSTWRHAWDTPFDGGYQQTRTMTAAASGGLFGVGAGNGWLETIVAANTDMVFGVVCEELGLIIGILLVLAIILFAVYAIKYAENARSSFYTIAAVAASALFIFQMMLNVLGCVDILPFTGVTFPFVSKGGSSLISCWGMLAFIKACDTRQNASFTVKMPKKVKVKNPVTKKKTVDNYTEYKFTDEVSDSGMYEEKVDDFFGEYDDRWVDDDQS